jgi:hypothetical protein
MKRQAKQPRTKSFKQPGRLPRIAIVMAAVVLAVGVVAALSRQRARSNNLPAQVARTPMATQAQRFTTVEIAGQKVEVDGQGQIKPLTPEEARKLADGLKVMLNRSSDGLEAVKQADGSVSMDLQGRFQNVAVAKRTADGSVAQSCVDNSQSAAAFFEIDPQLFAVQTKNSHSQKTNSSAQASIRTPAKGNGK